MRSITIPLIILSFVVMAGPLLTEVDAERADTGYLPPLQNREVLYNQAYTGTMDNAGQGDDQYLRAEDFVLEEVGCIESIEWWSVYIGSQSDTFHLRIYDDNDSAPGTLLWEVPAITAVNTDTGDDFTGYNIYQSLITLDPADYFQTEEDKIYWFSMYYNGSGFYWGLLTDEGNMALSYDGGDWSNLEWIGFFRLNGTSNQALEATTWGAIKTAL